MVNDYLRKIYPPSSLLTIFHGILELWKSVPEINKREEAIFRKRGAA